MHTIFHFFTFQHLAHASYCAPIAHLTVRFSPSESIIRLLFTKNDIFTLFHFKLLSGKLGFSLFQLHIAVSRLPVVVPDFVLRSFFHKFNIVLRSYLHSILTQWTLLFGTYTYSQVYGYTHTVKLKSRILESHGYRETQIVCHTHTAKTQVAESPSSVVARNVSVYFIMSSNSSSDEGFGKNS